MCLMLNTMEHLGDILQASIDHGTEDEGCYLKDINKLTNVVSA